MRIKIDTIVQTMNCEQIDDTKLLLNLSASSERPCKIKFPSSVSEILIPIDDLQKAIDICSSFFGRVEKKEKELKNRVDFVDGFLSKNCVQCKLYKNVKENQEVEHERALKFAIKKGSNIIFEDLELIDITKWYQCSNCFDEHICEETKFCPDCGIQIIKIKNQSK